MATTTTEDLLGAGRGQTANWNHGVLYPSLLAAGTVERVASNIDVIGAASNGAIRVVDLASSGFERHEGHFAETPTVSQRITQGQSPELPAAVENDLLAAQMLEQRSLKISQRYGPHSYTENGMRKSGYDSVVLSQILGQRFADVALLQQIQYGCAAVVGALQRATRVVTPSPLVLTVDAALDLLEQQEGDTQGEIACWVTNSTSWRELQADQQGQSSYTDAGFFGRVPVFLGRPVMLIDDLGSEVGSPLSSPLNNFRLLVGLREGAITLEQSEAVRYTVDEITGREEIVQRVQGEGAFNIRIMGQSWSYVNAGTWEPTPAQLSVPGNWEGAAGNPAGGRFAGSLLIA